MIYVIGLAFGLHLMFRDDGALSSAVIEVF
jgi:hypothetical protein